MLICSPLLALRLCSSIIFSCQPLFLLNAVSPAAPLIGIATRFDIPITPSPSILLFLDMLWDISLCVFKLCIEDAPGRPRGARRARVNDAVSDDAVSDAVNERTRRREKRKTFLTLRRLLIFNQRACIEFSSSPITHYKSYYSYHISRVDARHIL